MFYITKGLNNYYKPQNMTYIAGKPAQKRNCQSTGISKEKNFNSTITKSQTMIHSISKSLLFVVSSLSEACPL